MKGLNWRTTFCWFTSMVFTNDLTPRAKYPKGSAGYKKTLLKEGSTVGANATIVCGHTIGKWAMIAAGAVVTKNVKNQCINGRSSGKKNRLGM